MLALFLLVFLAFSVSAVTSITSCKYEISTQGDYNLTQAITSTGQPCINITSSNVTLNCEGFSLTGAGMNPGVWINRSLNNITIKNCKFDLFAPNIYVPLGGKEIYIINNTINSSPSYGVYFITVNNSRIENNTIAFNGDEDNEAGIYAYFSNHNLIKNNTIIHGGVTSESVYGVRINTGESNNITDNFIFNNSDMGIITESSPNTRIINNVIENNSWSNDDQLGIYIVLNANKTVIINNTVRHHSYGIYMTYADHVNITDNTVNNNSNGGIVALDGKYVLVKNNFVYNNTYGIGLVTYVDANITNNTIQDETYGIFSQANTENSSVYRNTIKGGDNGMTFISNSRYNTIKYNNISSTVDILVKSSLNNNFFDNTVSSYLTQFSFVEYSGDVNVSGVSTPPATSPYRNISLYLNVSGTDWVVMNISYANADISNIEENSVTMIHYDGSDWIALNSSLDKTNKDVSANLTTFSIFALLANLDCGVVNDDLILLSNISTSASCLIINASNLTINCNNKNITGTKADNSRGIHLNATKNVTVKNCNVYNFTSGIYLEKSNTSSIYNNTFSLNSNGLDISYNSADNIFTLNNVSYSTLFDLHMDSGANNKFFDITMGPVSTTVGLCKYSEGLHLFGVPNPSANPAGKKNVSSYINITKTDGEYIELNMSYSDSIVSNNNIDESTLKMYHYSDYNTWVELSSTVDSTNNVVYSNISNFSAFGLFGDEITASAYTGGGSSGGSSSTILNIKSYNITESLVSEKSFLTDRLYKSDYLYFDYKNLEHKITIKEILYSNKALKIEIASIPQEHWVYWNKDLNVDVDGNGYDDLIIAPNSISLSYTVLNITVLNENAPEPITTPSESETVPSQIMDQPVADEISPEQKVTELVRGIFPGISEEKASYVPIIVGILGVVIILFALFFWLKKEKVRRIIRKIPKRKLEKEIVEVPIKKTTFKPGLLKAFKNLKKRKIIQSIISSKKEPAKTTFYPSLAEAFEEPKKVKSKSSKPLSTQKSKTSPAKKSKKKHTKTKKKKKARKQKAPSAKPIKKEAKAIKNLRVLSKQEKQPNVFDDLQHIYSDIIKKKK